MRWLAVSFYLVFPSERVFHLLGAFFFFNLLFYSILFYSHGGMYVYPPPSFRFIHSWDVFLFFFFPPSRDDCALERTCLSTFIYIYILFLGRIPSFLFSSPLDYYALVGVLLFIIIIIILFSNSWFGAYRYM